MKSKLCYIVAGLALAGAVSAQIAPPPAPPPINGGTSLLAQIRFLNNLSFGMEGGGVFELQYVLQVQGYLPVDHVSTNYFGIKTRGAVMAYQQAKNLPATGFVGPLTRAALNGEAPGPGTGTQETTITANMGIGSSSGQVRLLQNKLLALGYFLGEVTGYFGIKTRAAVIAFQQAQGISPTGYVGVLTRAALNNTIISPVPPPENVEQITMREGQREGPFLLQKVYSDYVTGLNFSEYPVATGQGNPVTLRVGQVVSNGCTITLTLVRVESTNQPGPTATFLKKIDSTQPCPICLPGNAAIDTPNGQISVKNIQEGTAVWTRDANGNRVAAPIVKTSKVVVPDTHQMVSLKLEDGRSLLVSPGHPTADGRMIGGLAIGDMFDGSNVVSTELISYAEGITYDILPEGTTGTYWADGILIGSTLK